MSTVPRTRQPENPRPTLRLRKPRPVDLLNAPPPAPPAPIADEVFWILWNPANRRPAKRHATLELALAEQQRLQTENPDAAFWCYECRRVG